MKWEENADTKEIVKVVKLLAECLTLNNVSHRIAVAALISFAVDIFLQKGLRKNCLDYLKEWMIEVSKE